MNIITCFTFIFNFVISRLSMISQIHSITLISSDFWANRLVHCVIAIMELFFYFWLIRFVLNTLHFGTYFFKFFALIGAAFVKLFHRSSLSPEQSKLVNAILEKLNSQPKRY